MKKIKKSKEILPLEYFSIVRVFQHLGFRLIRDKGSHNIFRNPDGRTTCIVHKKVVGVPAILAYLRQAKICKDDFLNSLNEIFS